MNTCKNCGKEIQEKQKTNNIFCSAQCCNQYKKNEKIMDWLSGKCVARKNGYLPRSVREYLINKSNNQCEKCGWHEINPVTNKIPLEIHHVDGDYTNCSIENLQVLCPNCHQLTENYKALNGHSDITRTQTRKQRCLDCGKEINSNSIRCVDCENKHRITQKPVTREELKQSIRTTSFDKIGMTYNVQGNSIKKWCIQFGIPHRRKDINAISDEDWYNI